MLDTFPGNMAPTYALSSPGVVCQSDNELDGTDYLLSSTIRLEDNIFHVFGEFQSLFVDDKSVTFYASKFLWFTFK